MQIPTGGISMSTRLLLVFGMLFAAAASHAMADEVLVFPKTEAEIVDVLSSDQGRPIYIIGGKTIYMIEVKRSPQKDPELENAPKAGALIHFDFDSAVIKEESHSLLDEFGKALKGGLADGKFIIAGHTDSKGPEEYNLKLSEERASAVKDYLITRHEIDPPRLQIKAYGESDPIASNKTDEDRRLNRRVEFIRLGEAKKDSEAQPAEKEEE
jgi:outer membrane protein OmpA-like peptidoglycan-associated protein